MREKGPASVTHEVGKTQLAPRPGNSPSGLLSLRSLKIAMESWVEGGAESTGCGVADLVRNLSCVLVGLPTTTLSQSLMPQE